MSFKGGDTINHQNYIGKKLRDLVNDPHFCGGYYIVGNCNSKHPFSDEKYLNMMIEDISDVASDYTYFIKLK